MYKELMLKTIPNCPNNVRVLDANDAPIKLYGTYMENGKCSEKYLRLPEELHVEKAIDDLKLVTTGVRVRFETDSDFVCILGKTGSVNSFRERYGFDLRVTYEDGYVQSRHVMRNDYSETQSKSEGDDLVYPEHKVSALCSACSDLYNGCKKIEIMFPHYCATEYLKIGVSENANVYAPTPYKFEKPVVFAGSSITQGINASRPQTTYEAQISHALDCDYLNLGFSGNFRAQKLILDYIKSLDMSVFVYDYDHNAPTVDFLRETHEPFFREIREAHPELPVIFVSKPDFLCNERDGAKRRSVIYDTYSNAISRGDRNVTFIDGETLFKYAGIDPAICTFDGCHPNDLGFYAMACVIGEAVKKHLMNSHNL